LISSEGGQLIQRVGQSGGLNVAQNRIELFAAQTAINRTAQDAILDIRTKLKASVH
jgi:hypothetical protein